MNILVTGANLINKGAQSMLFVTVDQLKKRFPNSNIFYGTYRGDSMKPYKFKRMYYDPFIIESFLNDKIVLTKALSQELWNIGKFVLRRSDEFNSIIQSCKLIHSINMIIDISGFALSDKWSYKYNQSYLDNIRVAKKLDIPIYLMPQSFGPFDFDKNMSHERSKKLKNDIRKLLSYPSVIFAREVDSKHNLEKLGVVNVILSSDLVLQAKSVDYGNVINDVQYFDDYTFGFDGRKKYVAIIPNQQISLRGFKDVLLNEYDKAIDFLNTIGYYVCIVQHSGEDKELCQEISNRYAKNAMVYFIDKELQCYQYSEFIKKFSFVISSRFHAAVHAIKECIPTIAVGWAAKYDELLDSVGMGEYVFDITKNYKEGCLLYLVKNLDLALEVNRIQICVRLNEIQQHSCFDYLGTVIAGI